ncbi:ATPase [Klebsiella michiganensis]|nr:ATPase [Klebsiella michiganensis]
MRNLCARLPILLVNQKDIRRWIVSAGVIAGVALVFLLLVYLVYALIHAEAF